jgi:hypothetical protein
MYIKCLFYFYLVFGLLQNKNQIKHSEELFLEQKLNWKSEMKLKERCIINRSWKINMAFCVGIRTHVIRCTIVRIPECLSHYAIKAMRLEKLYYILKYFQIMYASLWQFQHPLIPTQKDMFIFQHSLGCLASFFQFHFWFSVQFLFYKDFKVREVRIYFEKIPKIQKNDHIHNVFNVLIYF